MLTALAQLQPHQEVRLRLQIALQPGRHEWIELFAKGHAPADDNHPAPRITAAFHLINDRVRQEQQLLYLAQHDALTNLLNRRTILERLETAIAPNDQRDPHLAVLFVDLDEFKRINDSHGHAAGDLVLQETASRIQQCIRHGDSVGRLGGDELLVVLRNIHTAADAMDVAHKIHQACQRPVLYQRTSIAISVSIGVGLAQPGDSPAALQIRADQALYSAKEQGRNRVIQVHSAPP